MSHFGFELLRSDVDSSARRGRFDTPHGAVETPAFMPVGTQGTVKGVTADQVLACGAQMILANTYHLFLRPGHERIRSLGGLHTFCGWSGPILTDSGGFQIFSLADLTVVTEAAAEFRSHIDGSRIRLSPEDAMAIQEDLGSDVAMVLDHVIGLPATHEAVQEAMERSIRWAGRCLNAATRQDQARFAIIQGGLDLELRRQCAVELIKLPFEGFAVGGLSVGEAPEDMYHTVAGTTIHLPVDRPRYLMGVGRPIDLVENVARGIDLFDCVMPTRNGRNGLAFTSAGPLKLRNACHQDDPRPLEADCPCAACRHSRAYLAHLFRADEMLGPILLSIHNLTYYQRLMAACRDSIMKGTFVEFLAVQRQLWKRDSRIIPTSGLC